MAKDATDQEHRITIAGFGGQGILTMGRLLCGSAMKDGKQVTYLPSYGSEVRGGTAHCYVVISPEPIFSPFVEMADSLIIFNHPSFERFGDAIRAGGLVLLNSSMVEPGDYERTHRVVLVPIRATELAAEMGNVVVGNVLLLGAFVAVSGICRLESVEGALREFLTGPKTSTLELNLRALRRGAEIGTQSALPTGTAS